MATNTMTTFKLVLGVIGLSAILAIVYLFFYLEGTTPLSYVQERPSTTPQVVKSVSSSSPEHVKATTTTKTPPPAPVNQCKGKMAALRARAEKLQAQCVTELSAQKCEEDSIKLYADIQTHLQECGYTEG